MKKHNKPVQIIRVWLRHSLLSDFRRYGIKMNKVIMILLLIMIPFQGIIYAMPVPSECSKERSVPVYGGGVESDPWWSELVFWLIFTSMWAGPYMLLDESESNDVWGYMLVMFWTPFLIVSLKLPK